MIPLKLKISGARGILAGLGLKELQLDFTRMIPDDAITIAIKGDNGSGKSTLLNLAMTPWREPPMLAGSIYDAFENIGLRELEFSRHDEVYRSRIEIKQTPKTRSQRAYLHILTSEGWEPASMPDGTVSDGKTRTYDTCLTSILGPMSLYYMSAFRAQNAPKLGEYDDPKGLMRDLLALDEYAVLRDRAKNVRREVKRRYEGIRDESDQLEDRKKELTDLEFKLSSLQTETGEISRLKSDKQDSFAAASADLASFSSSEAENEKLRKKRGTLEERIQASKREWSESQNTIRTDMARAKQSNQKILGELEDSRASLTRRVETAEKLIGRRDEIRAAALEAKTLDQKLMGQEKELFELRKLCEDLHEKRRQAERIKAREKQQSGAARHIMDKIKDLTRRSEFVDVVPCGGVGEYGACPALRDAKDAEGKIKTERDEMDGLIESARQFEAEAEILEKEAAPLIEIDARRKEVEAEYGKIMNSLMSLREVAALGGQLDGAESEHASCLQELDALDTRVDEYKEKALTEWGEFNARLDKNQEKSAAELQKLESELDALPSVDSSERLNEAKAILSSNERALNLAHAMLEDNLAAIAEVKARSATLSEVLKSGAAIRDKAIKLADELSHWHLLAVAMQGIIDLSIEDAGPTIAGTANRLLEHAYGPRFTMRIVTQREQANGKLVECFDISVIDSESGLEASILQKSGGESVWLDKALSDSVGLYHQDAAGVHYECLFADESEDGLTQDRKAMFYKMDRAALEMGGYKRKFFISHNPDAWALADAVIDMEEIGN